MNQWNDPKLVISGALIALFAYAYLHNPADETMQGAIILAFATAYGYWLGSNKGDSQRTENTGAAFRAIEATANAGGTKPDVTLKPGETAQAQPEGEG